MTLTLRELLAIPQITNKVLAGSAGLDRPVVWAHACEMPAPWDWVGEGELLMSIGHCVPADESGQARFVRHLAEAGLCGVALGDYPPMPRLSQAMLDTADDLGFPVLLTAHDTPFSVVARAVATANQHSELQRLWQLSRLNVAVGSPGRKGNESLLDRVAKELGHAVFVVDARHGTEILTGKERLEKRVAHAIVQGVESNLQRLPARLHLDLGDASCTCFPVPSSRPAMLVIPDRTGNRIDPFAVLHLASLIAVEVERLTMERENLKRAARQLFSQLIEGRVDSDSAARQLRQHGIVQKSLTVAALHEDEWDVSDVLSYHGIAHLATTAGDVVLVLVEAAQGGDLPAVLGAETPVGTSSVVHVLSHIPDATREARWALQAARSQGGGHVDYAAEHPLFLPRTVTEAQNAARSVLGAVIDYDSAHRTELIRSLEVYLACDRSWKKAAEVLSIHKQTLGSRLAKIEQLTGRSLGTTQDVAECWMALLALRTVVQETQTPSRPVSGAAPEALTPRRRTGRPATPGRP
ncbi:PucR family transcriptional regulator [Streptomyces vastus]|uniref:PucR family transcriptional regulator n=1 Tax=Streptomyces vastus TaxID=285451 RepID=A0ABP6CR13_9ACTN